MMLLLLMMRMQMLQLVMLTVLYERYSLYLVIDSVSDCSSSFVPVRRCCFVAVFPPFPCRRLF